ncbi:hypothetical protein AVEN_231709-1 [Araneus ventricosus]|uniref:F-box domain-containing protein n=1 Tax=Araneus ventricosus TaxID=182803 RepID=A0A4Y2R479_ARAVE|nr:hypothetical protein AVEN_231709-1 [Araneus ventricosus]
MHVHQDCEYNALRFLKQLTLLRIHFLNCKGDSVPDFVALLQEIEPQLKHLSVIGFQHRYPVDVICDCCPQSQSLEIAGFTFLKNSSEASSNLPLKRLKLWSNPPFNIESILFLFSNCKYLEELFFKHPIF